MNGYQNMTIPVAARDRLSAKLTQLFHPHTYKIAVVTFANGGDNIGIYTPLFAVSDFVTLNIILAIFFLLKGGCCYAAYRLARHPKITNVLTRSRQIVVPVLLLSLGTFILWKNATFKLLLGE